MHRSFPVRIPIRTRALLTAALLLPLAVACSGGGGEGADGGGGGGRAFLSIGTAPPGGAFYPVGNAISETLNQNKGDNGWEVTAEGTKGTQENIRRLARGELDLAMANSAITYFAVRGEGGWDQTYDMRAVVTLAPNVALFVTTEGSNIRQITDLKGKRVSVGPQGAGFEYFIRPLLDAHGVTYDDFEPVYGTQTQAVDYLADGSVSAAFLGGAVPTQSITQAATTQDVFFVPYGAQQRTQLVADYLFFRPASIPAGTYAGQDEAFEGLDVGSMHLITSADKSDDQIYQLTKTIYENRQQIVAQHPAGRAINERNAARDTGTPFHPGAIRFYKEIGIWPEGD